MAHKFTLDALLSDLERVLDSKEFVVEKLTLSEAYLVVQACQLTAMHPNLGEQMVDRFIAIGRRMQEAMGPHVSEFFREFLEAGWHRDYDE